MGVYVCPNCKKDIFYITKDEKNNKLYGYDVYKLKCSNCGEILENDKYIFLLNTFRKTQNEIDNLVMEFSKDTDLLKKSINELIGLKKNTGDLDNILRKLNFIYYEEESELTNSPNTISLLIRSNLPSGIHGDIQNTKESGDTVDIKLTSEDKTINIGTIKIERELNNAMKITIKVGKKTPETITVIEPFRIMHVLLRINEILNYTN